MCDRYRSAWQNLVIGVLFCVPSVSQAQLTKLVEPLEIAATPRTGQYVMVGKLELRPEGYVLVGADGQPEAYLIPRKSLDMNSFVGQNVEATVRESTLRTGAETRLWVDELALPKQPAGTVTTRSLFDPAIPGQIAQTGHLQPVAVPQVATAPVAVSDRLVPESWGPRGWVWGSAEYLYWFANGMHIPPLVTTSPTGTAREDAGVLGEPDTQILYGSEDIFTSGRNGLRFRGGVWFDAKNRYGVQGEYFTLANGSEMFSASSETTDILARPFFNINPRDPFTEDFDPPARQDSQLIAYPGVLGGDVTVTASSQLQSAGLAFRELMAGETFCGDQGTGFSRVDVLLGYRHMRLTERLAISENLTSIGSDIPVSFLISDQFDTRNQFHGGDLGMTWQAGWGKWSVDLLVKTAVGNVQQEVTIQGATSASIPGGDSVFYDSGLLALPSNIGTYSRNRFAVIPELGVTVGFAIFPRLRATVGYSFIYWGTVVRPGDQIDLDINPDQLPPPISPLAGPLRPVFGFAETDYWLHGANVGLEGRW